MLISLGFNIGISRRIVRGCWLTKVWFARLVLTHPPPVAKYGVYLATGGGCVQTIWQYGVQRTCCSFLRYLELETVNVLLGAEKPRYILVINKIRWWPLLPLLVNLDKSTSVDYPDNFCCGKIYPASPRTIIIYQLSSFLSSIEHQQTAVGRGRLALLWGPWWPRERCKPPSCLEQPSFSCCSSQRSPGRPRCSRSHWLPGWGWYPAMCLDLLRWGMLSPRSLLFWATLWDRSML